MSIYRVTSPDGKTIYGEGDTRDDAMKPLTDQLTNGTLTKLPEFVIWTNLDELAASRSAVRMSYLNDPAMHAVGQILEHWFREQEPDGVNF